MLFWRLGRFLAWLRRWLLRRRGRPLRRRRARTRRRPRRTSGLRRLDLWLRLDLPLLRWWWLHVLLRCRLWWRWWPHLLLLRCRLWWRWWPHLLLLQLWSRLRRRWPHNVRLLSRRTTAGSTSPARPCRLTGPTSSAMFLAALDWNGRRRRRGGRRRDRRCALCRARRGGPQSSWLALSKRLRCGDRRIRLYH